MLVGQAFRPRVVRDILKDLTRYLDEEGLESLDDLVGTIHRREALKG